MGERSRADAERARVEARESIGAAERRRGVAEERAATDSARIAERQAKLRGECSYGFRFQRRQVIAWGGHAQATGGHAD